LVTGRRLVSLGAVAAAVATTALVGAGDRAGAVSGPGYVKLAGSAVPFASPGRVTGAVAGATALTIQVWLQPGHLAAAQQYATQVSTPGSALYHHYLSPAAYTARFGTSQTAAGKVETWLRQQGFSSVHTDAQRNYVRATGKVETINAVFRVQEENYRSSGSMNAGPYQLHANNQAVSIPTSLSRYVIGVTGLDNAAPRNPLVRAPDSQPATASQPAAASKKTAACSRFYGQHHISGLPRKFGQTSFPTQICGYSPAQMRAAYGMNTANNGRGQKISLVELGLAPDMRTSLKDWASAEHFTAPSAAHYAQLSLGKNTCLDLFFEEESLDVDAAYAMAPGAQDLVIGGDDCNNGDFGLQGLFDADIVNIDGTGHGPLSTISSNSWRPGDDLQPAIITRIMHAYLVRAAAVGVGMYFASGDSPGIENPGDPFTILVGGTSLGIGQHNPRLFETGWSTGLSPLKHGTWHAGTEDGAASGGPSLFYAQPAYQAGVVPTALATAPGDRPGLIRSEPDLAADADENTGLVTGALVPRKHKPPVFSLVSLGGTSLAAPLVAGMIADAQQGRPTAFGFTNPALYKLAGTAAYHDTLPSTVQTPARFRAAVCNVSLCGTPTLLTFDDQNRNLPGYTGQVTQKGYDTMTGLGTPNGQQFIAALRKVG
jgi:subtilase family serine protease